MAPRPFTLIPPPTVSVHASGPAFESDAQQADYNTRGDAAKFVFTRTAEASDQPLDVHVQVGGTASVGTNYNWESDTNESGSGSVNPSSGTIHFDANQTQVTAIVHAVDDHTPGWTKDVTVQVTDDQAYYVDDNNDTGTVCIGDSDLSVKLGDGTDGLILQGSADGKDNQTSLSVGAPTGGPSGATVTLSVSEPSDLVRVYEGDGTLVLGGDQGTSHTWTVGQGDANGWQNLKVGVIGGSAEVGDIQFHVADSDLNSQSDVPNPCTSNTDDSKDTTAVRLRIVPNNDPNNKGGSDWSDNSTTNRTPQDWLIGQFADMSAVLDGPQQLTGGQVTYSWTVPNSALRDYQVASDATWSKVVPLAPDDRRQCEPR